MRQGNSYEMPPKHCHFPQWLRPLNAPELQMPAGGIEAYKYHFWSISHKNLPQDCVTWLKNGMTDAASKPVSAVCDPFYASMGQCSPEEAKFWVRVKTVFHQQANNFWIPYAATSESVTAS
jgi:hypothetical protein